MSYRNLDSREGMASKDWPVQGSEAAWMFPRSVWPYLRDGKVHT